MQTITVELDPTTSARAQRLAHARGTTITALVQSLIVQLDASDSAVDSIGGLFADEPALLDLVVAQALHDREQQPLRADHG
ncbi:hypothetical protein [Candidatus Viridilinea mediisalina]|uniref:CopG family transcriptional regulator n=1 Tax=Candidatus Viridilinea mediisalina TaxID=2024553 RepID=A0A2A6RN12_9CHLR|nr:hypothetical protein [Candidatus Viridilinea mediisalina]PDW04291.1 hypothetical protein CJ255_04385 [Candidatus Viridilinea mediisalina]